MQKSSLGTQMLRKGGVEKKACYLGREKEKGQECVIYFSVICTYN